MFTHLQVHTHYSLLEAIGSPKGYIDQAQKLGMHALACTDYSGMYGVIEFYQAAKKANIKPLLGVELGYVADMSRQDAHEDPGMIVLLARTYTGYQQLLHLVSEAHLHGFHGIPRIDASCLKTYATDLIAISGGPRSWLGKQILAKVDMAYIDEQLCTLQSIVGKQYSLLSRLIQDQPVGVVHTVNQSIFDISKKHNAPMIISGDVHYIQKTDQSVFETALAIKDTKRIYDTDRRLANRDMHLHSEQEIITYATSSGISPEDITHFINTGEQLVEEISIEIPMNTILFPIYEPPTQIKESFNKWQNTLISS